MPWSPVPCEAATGSNPIPSSVTSNVRLPFASERRTVAFVALAYFATFWSASRQEKYTAASVSSGYRPVPSGSTSTAARFWITSSSVLFSDLVLLPSVWEARSLTAQEALRAGRPLVAIDHLEGHLYACQLAYPDRDIYPCLGLVVSGGHTSLYEVRALGSYRSASS